MNVRRRTVQNSLKSEVTLYNTAQLETYKTTTYVLYALFYSLRAYLMQAVPLASTSFDRSPTFRVVLHKSADNSRDVSVARSGPAEVALSPGAWLLYDGNNYFVIPGNGAALARIYRACTRRGCRNPRDRS